MSRRLFDSPPPSFNSIFEPPPFHNTLHYQEVLATLRYGIIARKGLIVLIGDAGMGKSTLLDQLTRELDTHVACIFESDPDVDFTHLLRLLLDNLESAGNSPNSLSMLRRCKVILRSQLEAGRVVALIIDNAERLRHETLEQLLHNFFSAPIDRDKNLLQIVLAGRPELAQNLAQPRLRSLKARAEIVCELQPLRDKDIAAYIETRLRAVNLPEEIFDSAALDQIAAYTGGNPRLINAISNRALQVSDGSPLTHVTAEMVARAAQSLDLSETWRPVKEPVNQDFEIPNHGDERFGLVEDDTTEVFDRTFLNSTFGHRKSRPWPAGRGQKVVRVLFILLLLAGGAAWLQSVTGKSELSNWVGKLSEIVGLRQKLESNANAPLLATQEAPTPGGEAPVPPTSESVTGNPPLSEAEKSADTSAPVLTEKATEKPPAIDPTPAPRKAPVRAGDSQAPPAGNADARRKLLEAQVYRAIENRAILGVTVSVINDIIYLDGQVATKEQRDTAERGAQSVAGANRVRNRIAVVE